MRNKKITLLLEHLPSSYFRDFAVFQSKSPGNALLLSATPVQPGRRAFTRLSFRVAARCLCPDYFKTGTCRFRSAVRSPESSDFPLLTRSVSDALRVACFALFPLSDVFLGLKSWMSLWLTVWEPTTFGSFDCAVRWFRWINFGRCRNCLNCMKWYFPWYFWLPLSTLWGWWVQWQELTSRLPWQELCFGHHWARYWDCVQSCWDFVFNFPSWGSFMFFRARTCRSLPVWSWVRRFTFRGSWFAVGGCRLGTCSCGGWRCNLMVSCRFWLILPLTRLRVVRLRARRGVSGKRWRRWVIFWLCFAFCSVVRTLSATWTRWFRPASSSANRLFWLVFGSFNFALFRYRSFVLKIFPWVSSLHLKTFCHWTLCCFGPIRLWVYWCTFTDLQVFSSRLLHFIWVAFDGFGQFIEAAKAQVFRFQLQFT